ncbi:hypothetical protein LguiB_028218 [Lonicera macranthoides]
MRKTDGQPPTTTEDIVIEAKSHEEASVLSTNKHKDGQYIKTPHKRQSKRINLSKKVRGCKN